MSGTGSLIIAANNGDGIDILTDFALERLKLGKVLEPITKRIGESYDKLKARLAKDNLVVVQGTDGKLYTMSQGDADRLLGSRHTQSSSSRNGQSGSGGGNSQNLKKEVVLPAVDDYNQARNQAQEILGDLGADSKPYISRLESSSVYNQVVGRVSADGKRRWRLDYDPEKGLHINVEDFSRGKTPDKVIKRVIPINNGDINSLIKHLNR